MTTKTYLLMERSPDGRMTVATAYSTKEDALRGSAGRDPKRYTVVSVWRGRVDGAFGPDMTPPPQDRKFWTQARSTASDYLAGKDS